VPYLEPVAVLAAAAVATRRARIGASVFILGHRHPVVMAKMLTTKELWTSDHPRFQGEFYRFDDLGFAPKPVQKPHPPIWVGGDSPGAFRRVVTLGDGWHATSKTPDELRGALARLRAAADAARRPFETIALSIRVSLKQGCVRDARQVVVDQLGAYKALGLTHVMLDFRRDSLGEMLEILDLVAREIRPAVDAA
jgi:alkanesulfonate monooxygenase SsuD/methylene tetrahydromethanopterin reductase-like flavin-dependent oxidoreductase (luciferase family)